MGWLSDLAHVAGNVLNIKALKDNKETQKDFAQHGIRWKVADAQKAGIHPLYALGASTTSYSPIPVGDYGSIASGLVNAGQDIARSVNATRTGEERDQLGDFIQTKLGEQQQRDLAQKQTRSFELDMQHKELQNSLLAAQLMGMNRAQNPPFPTAGKEPPMYTSSDMGKPGGSGLVIKRGSAPAVGAIEIKPSEITSTHPGDRARLAGRNAAWDRFDTGDNTVDLPSNKLSQALEDMGILKYYYTAKRNLENWQKTREPKTPLPPGYRWEYDYTRRAYKAVRVN